MSVRHKKIIAQNLEDIKQIKKALLEYLEKENPPRTQPPIVIKVKKRAQK